MFKTLVWEDDKYKIEINSARAVAYDKETREILANLVPMGSPEYLMDMLKQLLAYRELGNPTTELLWENENYRLRVHFYDNYVDLIDKRSDRTVAEFPINIESIKVLKKVIAFL
jgi:hypothetical protein